MNSLRQLDIPLEQHPKRHIINYLSSQFFIDPILGHYLFIHGMDDEEKLDRFLEPDMEKHLHNPFLLNDMKKAVSRIIEAINQKEAILIFGDYDCDGITSTSLLYFCIEAI